MAEKNTFPGQINRADALFYIRLRATACSFLLFGVPVGFDRGYPRRIHIILELLHGRFDCFAELLHRYLIEIDAELGQLFDRGFVGVDEELALSVSSGDYSFNKGVLEIVRNTLPGAVGHEYAHKTEDMVTMFV